LPHSRKGDSHLGGRRRIESVQPFSERFVSLFVNVAADLGHPFVVVTLMLPRCPAHMGGADGGVVVRGGDLLCAGGETVEGRALPGKMTH
jgi:hypothetical protein